jgi:ParB-like chromosome segregation protein Spo0J
VIFEARSEHTAEGDDPAVMLSLDKVVTHEYIRVAGIDKAHVNMLAALDEDLPPILVQRSTMRVIDGVHRLKAAELRGDTHIRARLLDLDHQAAFLKSVAANIAHGLPLSLADRKAAAARMIALYPFWSDRSLGRACGLSGKTISALRAPSPDGGPERRIGLDGRSRPMDSGRGRRIARELLRTRPDASMRQIAQEAGVSPGTVRKVRDSMRAETTSRAVTNGESSIPVIGTRSVPMASARAGRALSGPRRSASITGAAATDCDPQRILQNLRQDPSLIYRAKGRDLLRLLQPQPVLTMGQKVIDMIPSHCLPSVAALTRHYAQEWAMLTALLESRARRDAA